MINTIYHQRKSQHVPAQTLAMELIHGISWPVHRLFMDTVAVTWPSHRIAPHTLGTVNVSLASMALETMDVLEHLAGYNYGIKCPRNFLPHPRSPPCPLLALTSS